MNLQKKVKALDSVIKKISGTTDPVQLVNLPTWQKLVSLRESLTKLLSETDQNDVTSIEDIIEDTIEEIEKNKL